MYSVVKTLVRTVLNKFGLELTRRSSGSNNAELIYAQGGRVPWSLGYSEAKEGFIRQVLGDAQSLQWFSKQTCLPAGFGIGFDERCIEYPWLLAQLGSDAEVVLDAGSALNHALILEHPIFEKKKIYILTLAPETNCFWNKGISYLFQDVRNIPIRDAFYDTVACISTLEHVGCDNTTFTGDSSNREQRPDDFIQAMQEMSRVLKPGGRLLLTVPFGSYRHFGSFQQFDNQLLSQAVAAFGGTQSVSQVFYRYTAQGWDVATAQDCAGCEYVDWVAKMWSGVPRPKQPRREHDLAAAARAVACVKLTKA